MFNKHNPYTLRKEIVGGLTRYYVSFADGQGIFRETEVSRPVYLEFMRFVKAERRLRRWDERHLNEGEFIDEAVYGRTLEPEKSVEDTIFDVERSEQLRSAIQSLPETQRRRFILHHEFGLTYKQIAEIEKRHISSVSESIIRAEERIKKIIKFG